MKAGNNMKDNILVTGATGFLGTEIVQKLIEQTDKIIYVLVRADKKEQAVARLRSLWWEEELLRDSIGNRVVPVLGNITQNDLGIEPEEKHTLIEDVAYIIHSAAEVGIKKSKAELWQINVEGTQNVLRFAQEIEAQRGLKRFAHVSTAYVAGKRTGKIMENEDEECLVGEYSSLYEESKAAAEKLVIESGLTYSIYRPSMIVGRTCDGKVKNFNTIYYVLKLLLMGKLKWLPTKKSQSVNVVPVDYVANSVAALTLNVQAENKIFHLTVPKEMAPTVGELVEVVDAWAKRELKLDIGRVHYLPLMFLKNMGSSYNSRTEEKKKTTVSNLLALMPYFYDEHDFDRKNTDELIGAYSIKWQSYIENILYYACRKNFMNQTERNIFSQAMVRRSSKKAPVSYYDVAGDEMKYLSGEDMNEKILSIVKALRSLGISRGDKVALSGMNCTDYMALDMAIGLTGAVSVPIYYTTPIHEAEVLLRKSEAKCFFVGDKRIMKQIDQLKSDIIVINFANASEGVKIERKLMDWSEFIQGQKEEVSEIITDLGDLATIRYTSGTTGEPKGVMFDQYQLRWMGEIMTNLMDFRERNTSMRYLSFLPMSHVVEGILAAYAPYYMMGKIEIYYLNDFDALTKTLPKVRPTVFFSVPRFYEKLWQQLLLNPMGRYYVGMKDGSLKSLLGKVVRASLLKKAGLDQCGQLIVGSAPMSEVLLHKFRELGIEIHNAYGQTEAPLVTINRAGDNVIPSIGTVLPDTEVSVAEDGELIVTGPQVTRGYYGLESDSIQDGVLKTGDLGFKDSDGHVFISGRKKDILITSYGKNINRQKVEGKIKDIDGVSEAVLVGENRPYCTALIWLDETSDMTAEKLEEEIMKMNEGLSNPEKIKKWSVIATPLSIAKGELTPNLKVRRNNVIAHYMNEIDEMY